MVVRQNRPRDLIRSPVEALGVGRLVDDLADDAEIVQRVGEVGIERAELGLLHERRVAEQLFGGRVVAGRGGLFSCIDHGSSFARVRHEVHCKQDLRSATAQQNE